MDLASVVAALASVGVRVSGSTPNSSVQVDSSRACPTGLAGPEPSGTINDPGQHFQYPGPSPEGGGGVTSSLQANLRVRLPSTIPQYDRYCAVAVSNCKYSIKYQVPGPGGDGSASKGPVNAY